MAIRSLKDIHAAYEEGRWHTQRFTKNAGTAHSTQWADPTFASGQPAYDAHVGAPLAFTPAIATKNDSIWFPGIASGQERYLHTASFWTNQSTFNGSGSVYLFDLVGFYPLIDGDSADTQAFDNTLTLPRYTSGDGLQLVIVNHVAPAIQNGIALLEYVDSSGNPQSTTITIPNNGVNLVCSAPSATANVAGPVGCALANGTRGIQQLTNLTYTVPPGGLHCAYLIKPLGTCALGDNLLLREKDFYLHNGLAMPRIHDGAWLGWFDMIGAGTARTVAWYGDFSFIWG